MKSKRQCCGIIIGTMSAFFATSGGQLVTDNLDVLGTASFYGEVNVGWNDAGGSLTNGLVLYYDFNTNSGSVVLDGSGSSYNGNISGATWTTNGRFGGAYYFDGNDSISAGDILDAGGAQEEMTVCLWVKLPASLGTWPYIISKQQTASPYKGWLLAVHSAQTPFAQIKAGSSSYAERNGSITFSNGVWHFICVTYKSKTNYLEATLFFDGIKDGIGTDVDGFSSIDTAAALTIGSREGSNSFFTGYIDDVRIYNRVLADNEITGMYSTFLGYEGRLNVKDLIVDNKIVQVGTNSNVFMGPTGIGVTNPVGQLQVGGMLNVDGNIRLNDNWLSGDGDNEGVAVSSDGTVAIMKLQKQGDIEMGSYTNHP